MASALDDLLLRGITGRSPWKAEAVACATTNVTLSGEQTIDGISIVADDGVLLTGQTNLAENGVWDAATGAWQRRADFSDVATARIGTTVLVARGTANSGVWRMASPITGYVRPGITATTWIKVSAFAASAAYTAGDGITINPTGNAIGVNLASTAIFTTAGTPSRVPVIDGAGYITALGGVYANTLNAATAAAMSVGTANQTSLTMGRVTTPTVILGNTIEITGTLTNNGSPISGGSVTESAVRSAAAGFTATLAVNGQTVSNCAGVSRSSGALTVSTSFSGDLTVSSAAALTLGAAGAINCGTTAATTIAIGRAGLTSCTVNGGTTLTCTGATTQINGSTLVDINAGALDIDCTGAFTVDGPSAAIAVTGTASLQGGGTTHLTSTGGAAYMLTPAGSVCSLNGTIQLRCGDNTVALQNYNGSETRVLLCFPTSVTPGSAAATSIGTVTVPASSSGGFTSTISIRNGSANHEAYDLKFDWNSDATTVTASALTTAARAATAGVIGTVPADVTATVAGLVVTILVANASGFRCALRGRADNNL